MCVCVCTLQRNTWHNSSWPRVTFYCVGSHFKRRHCHTSISKEDYKLVKIVLLFVFSFQRLIMSSYKHTGNATVLKYKKVTYHYQSYRCTQGPASWFDCNTVKCLKVFDNFISKARSDSDSTALDYGEEKGWLGITKGSKLPSLSLSFSRAIWSYPQNQHLVHEWVQTCSFMP